MVNKTDRKEELCDIVLKNIVRERIKSIDPKSCRMLIEILTIMKAMKLKSLSDFQEIISKERPEVVQGIADVKSQNADQTFRKSTT